MTNGPKWNCQFPRERYDACTVDAPHTPGCDWQRVADHVPYGVITGDDGTYFAKGRTAVQIGWDWVPQQGLGWNNGPGARHNSWYEVRPPVDDDPRYPEETEIAP